MREIWKDIEGYEGKYQVSNFGRVRSLNYNQKGIVKELKLVKHSRGYRYVSLRKDGQTQHYFVHRLVYETFIGPIPDGMVVNHIDEDKTNNRVDNLNLLSAKENTNWGTAIKRMSKSHKGMAAPQFEKVVVQLTPDGKPIKEYRSFTLAAKDVGVSVGAISQAVRKGFVSGGFRWAYK